MNADMRPQDVHFDWEDIMSYKTSAWHRSSLRRSPSKPILAPPSVIPSLQDLRDDMYDSDVDIRSQCSEAESSFSTGLFSNADSLSTQTTMSNDAAQDEDHIEFLPSYQNAIKKSDMSPPSIIGYSVSDFPVEDEKCEDDLAVNPPASKHVDFLSHAWCEDDITTTWKFLQSTRNTYNNRERLSNVAWRLWMKQRHQLDTTHPLTINWRKDRDVTWLYGPLKHGSESESSSSNGCKFEQPASVKPILKKPTLSEELQRRSISTASLMREAAKAYQERDLHYGAKSRSCATFQSLSFHTKGKTHRHAAPAKSVRFSDEVEESDASSPVVDEDSHPQSVFDLSSEDESDEESDSTPPKFTKGVRSSFASVVAAVMAAKSEEPSSDESDIESVDLSDASEDSFGNDPAEDYFGDFMNHEDTTSSHVTEHVLDPVREDLVERAMNEFWVIFNQEWDTGYNQCAGGPTSPGSVTPPVSQPSKQIQRKRQKRDDDNQDEDEENSRQPRQPRQPTPMRNFDYGVHFACPFRKNNSQTYNIYNYRVCALSHWQTIARVKEHVYRCHQMPAHCKRCWSSFKTQQQLDAHITVDASQICAVRPGSSPEGITPEIERKLRSRKKTHPSQTDEDRWKEIYKLLFPNTQVPSPYFEAVQEESPSSPDSRELANYEEYIRRELPRLVRSNIEAVVRRETKPLEASLIGNLVSIIQDCQDRVFRSYRQSQGIESETPTTVPESSPSAGLYPDEDIREDLDFLDAAFHAPMPTVNSAQDLQNIRGKGEGMEKALFSDSGYASEPACGCRGMCVCRGTEGGIDERLRDTYTENVRVKPWMDSLSYPSWQHVDAGGDDGDEADWWMNI